MTKYRAEFSRISGRLGRVELYNGRDWAGSFRVDRQQGVSLKETAYSVANREAALKGGRLDRFKEVRDES